MNTKERITKAKESWVRYHDVDAVVEDVNELLDDDEFQARHVESVELDSGRWYDYMLEVIELDKGFYVGLRWDSGLTESQENMYDDDNVYLLKREEKVVTTVEWKTKEAL